MSLVQLSSNIVNIIKTQNGIDGLNLATIFLYQRAASLPSVPLSNVTYIFSTGLITGNIGGWSQSMPIKNSNPCWVTTAVVISREDLDTIYSSDWKQPEKLAEDGADGTSVSITSTSHAGNTTTVNFSDGTSITIDDGADGKGILSIVEYYKTSSSDDTPPTGTWYTTLLVPDANNPYLWNYEYITYTDGNDGETSKRIIGTYSAPGTPGADGKGIANIINYYAKTAGTTAPLIGSLDWIACPPGTIPTLDATDKYLWNYEHTVYTDDTSGSTTPHIISMYAKDGRDGKDAMDVSQYTIHTNVLEVLKFITDLSSGEKYDIPLDELRINAYNIKDQIPVSNTQIVNLECVYTNLDINIADLKLKEIIKENLYSTYIYVELSSPISLNIPVFFYFNLSIFYRDLSNGTLRNNLNDSLDKDEIIKNISEFFNNDVVSTDIIIYGQVVELSFIKVNIDKTTFDANKTIYYTKSNNEYIQCTESSEFIQSTDYYAQNIIKYNIEKYIPIKNGLSSEMLKFSVNAGSINSAIQNTKLKFNENGLTITNGGIRIYTGDEVPGSEVFRIEGIGNEARLYLKGSGEFTGTVHAQNGEFTGTVHAQNGEFNGTVNAGRGSIGGFTIDENSIYAGSNKDNSPLLLQSSDGSLINVDNILIGTGAKIKDYLQLGNLKLLNPELYPNVMELKVANLDYFILTNDGNILGKNWSITKDTNGFVTANFGNIIAQDGIFSGEIIASIINATTINTVNFVTEKARSMGGAFIFKPTFKINNIEKKGNNIVEFELELSEEERKYFNLILEEEIKANIIKKEHFYIDDNGLDLATENTDIIEWIPVLPNETCRFSCVPGNTLRRIRIHEYSDISEFLEGTPSFNTWVRQAKNIATTSLTPNEEYTVSWTTSATTKYLRISIGVEYSSLKVFLKLYIVGASDDSVHFGYITDVSDRNNNKISVKFFNTDYNNIDNVNSLTLFGRPYNDSLIGINSDSNSVGDILPPRALVMEDFTLLQNSDNEIGDLNYIPKLILGDLSSLMAKNIPGLENISGYGLYADNVFLRGSLTTSGGNNNYAGVNTLGPISFNYNSWSTNGAITTSSSQYANDKIIFWGGATGVETGNIQNSPFIVTDKGNVFARSGEFKGSVISDSLITNTIIKAPVIYGNNSLRLGHENEPSLKIYNTDTSTGGIGFYKLVGLVDEERSGVDLDDILTLSISTNGFTHFNNEFISFNENNGNIIFTGTKYVINNTELRDKELINEASGIYFNLTDDSKLKLDYNSSRGIEITKDLIINYGGYTVNEGIVEIKTIVLSNTTKTLKYYVNSENYYCLMVS